MQPQTADIIDFQAYRRSRGKAAQPVQAAAAPVMMQPVMMWMPVWSFVPVVAPIPAAGLAGDAP